MSHDLMTNYDACPTSSSSEFNGVYAKAGLWTGLDSGLTVNFVFLSLAGSVEWCINYTEALE